MSPNFSFENQFLTIFVKYRNLNRFNFNFSTDFSTTHQERRKNSSFANFGRGLDCAQMCYCGLATQLSRRAEAGGQKLIFSCTDLQSMSQYFQSVFLNFTIRFQCSIRSFSLAYNGKCKASRAVDSTFLSVYY
jgi:hypothetical protein